MDGSAQRRILGLEGENLSVQVQRKPLHLGGKRVPKVPCQSCCGGFHVVTILRRYGAPAWILWLAVRGVEARTGRVLFAGVHRERAVVGAGQWARPSKRGDTPL